MQDKREQMIRSAQKYRVSTYLSKTVAPEFQRMIRAEAGASNAPYTICVVNGKIDEVHRRLGQVGCVTCGKVSFWSGSGLEGMHTGHFLASRCASIVLEEDNVAPQCSRCNRYRDGMTEEFIVWMQFVRGSEVIERLRWLKAAVSRRFSIEELVDLRIAYRARIANAIADMI